MSTLPRAEPRRAYSWWWDSHISPKNSKWLQENLKDMDVKVKSMIKLIEEDADSFARRAEMYYKKRPELMKLVEEFYRAYRALAERYDHATGALRHAHRTMSEAFPNHIPLALPDESLSNNSPEMITSRGALYDSDDLPKDTFGFSAPFGPFDGKETNPEVNEALATKKGLKHFNEMAIPRVMIPEGSLNVQEEEGMARVRLTEGKVRKSLNFEDQENTPNAKVYIGSKNHLQPEHNENAKYGIKHLQEQVSQLSSENQRLKAKIELESKHLNLSKAEVQNLRDLSSKLETEKDAALLQNQLSDEAISSLEIEISKVKNEIKKLNEEMEIAALKLSTAEKQCFALEKANQTLQLELEHAKRELEGLRLSLIESNEKNVKAEMSLQSTEQLYNQSSEKVMLMTLEIQILAEKLKEIEHSKCCLEKEVCELKDMNHTLNEHNSACALQIGHLEEEIISLKKINGKLEDEIEIHVESKKILQQELDSLKVDRIEIDLKHQCLTKQMEKAYLQIESLETLVKELQAGHAELKECCGELESEKLFFLNKLNDMESVSERNSVLENSLSEANVELGELRKQIKILEDMRESLDGAVSTHIGEKAVLASQLEILAANVEKLSEKSTLLEKSLDDANTELEGLRSKLRDLEESCQSLSHANLDLLAQKNELIPQLERIQQIVANLETTRASLELKQLKLIEEKDLSANKILNLENSLSLEHENQLCLLQENRQVGEELEEEHQRCFSHMTEIFILQRSLYDTSDSLIIEKQKYMSLIQSKEIQLAALERQIQFIQEETKVRDNRIEEEEQKSMSYMLEIFILQKCLFEMKDGNFTLLQEFQKLLEASRSANELVKQLESRDLIQKKNISSLMDHISKVRDGIHLFLKPLNINQELMNIDGSEAVILSTILGEIENLLTTVSNFHDENQVLGVETWVYLSLLKQSGLEKTLLFQEIEKINRHYLVLRAEVESLTRKLEDSLKELNNSREERNALEVENSLIHIEAMTLDHLYLFFRTLNDERLQQLKLFSGDMCSLLTIKNGLEEEIRGSKERVKFVENENKQLSESLVLLEELRSLTTILEFDVFTASGFCEELALQVEVGDNFLKEKSMELSNANVMLHSKQGEIDEAKMMISELEKKVIVLLEGTASKDEQIASVYEENRTLNVELNRFKCELEALKTTERCLSYELQKEREEVVRCEGEMIELFSEVQNSVVNAAVLDEKVFELACRCDSLEISAMVHDETLKEEIALRISNEVELEKKLYDFENENGNLRTNMKALSPLFFSLGNEISYVEKYLCQLAELHGHQESPSHRQENHETSIIDRDHSTMEGVLEMQNLIAKVESLQRLVIGTKSQLDQQKLQSAANLESARREIEALKLKESSYREEKQGMDSSNMVKDIELDQVSNSCGVSRIQSAEPNDQTLKLWEIPDGNFENRTSSDHDIESVEEVKNDKPSSGHVYKLELSREIKESQDEWNRMAIKRLASHADKLCVLRASARELKLKMERSGARAHQNRLQFNTLKTNLEGVEKAIFDLLNRNGKLAMMIELSSSSFNGEDMGFAERRKVLEQVRSESDRIEMLELELQKIDYIFLKLEEECENYTSKGGERTPRVLLRDYLYGRKDGKGKRRSHFCGCVRPRTRDDY